MLYYPDFEGLTCFSNIFGTISLATEFVNNARLCVLGDGDFGFHLGSSAGGRRLVCHYDVVASKVSG